MPISDDVKGSEGKSAISPDQSYYDEVKRRQIKLSIDFIKLLQKYSYSNPGVLGSSDAGGSSGIAAFKVDKH